MKRSFFAIFCFCLMAPVFAYPFQSTSHAEDNPEGNLLINETLYGDSTNFGRIYNYNTALHGMWGKYNMLVNALEGEIQTFGSSAYGIYGTESSNISNYGSIITRASGAHGLYATKTSIAKNSGLLHTYGVGAYGANVREGSTFQNTSSGVIITENKSTAGISAFSATANNSGIIRAYGDMSRGMAGTWFSELYNEGLVEIGQSSLSYGLWAIQNSSILNSGTVNVLGDESFGMYISQSSTATNTGEITTQGSDSPGIYADDSSTAVNYGTVTTHGYGAFGVVAKDGSKAKNYKDITTYGQNALGMFGTYSAQLFNLSSETIETWGDGASGMVVSNDSYGENTGRIITHGNEAHGLVAYDSSSIINKESGEIITYGERSYGMYIYGNSAGTNSGKIAVYGKDSHAVVVEEGSFYNLGELYSEQGAAVVATKGSSIILGEGTTLSGSNLLVGDGTSNIEVNVEDSISACISGFGSFTKDGKGSLLLEGNSFASNSYNNAGTLIITEGSQFFTNNYFQGPNATLKIVAGSTAPSFSAKKAVFDGKINIDISNLPAPGDFEFITVGYLDGSFASVTFEDETGHLLLLSPEWVYEYGKWHYRSAVTYSFSEQALGLVAAIEEREIPKSVLFHRIEERLEQKSKAPSFYGDLLKSESTRSPSEFSLAGFNTETRGIILGSDYKSSNDLIQGICVGYMERNVSFTDVPMAKADWEEQKEWLIGGYIGKKFSKWALLDVMGYRRISHDAFRKQLVSDVTASFQSWSISKDIRFIYFPSKKDYKNQTWRITPQVGLNWEHFKRASYSEAGGISYDAFDADVIQSILGISTKRTYAISCNKRFSSQFDILWLHLLEGKDITIKAFHDGKPIQYKEVLDKDRIFINLSLSLENCTGATFSLSYWGHFSNSGKSHGASAKLEWKL
ncbi:MAG: autotransporter domain-containing protein [Thermovirga sp.]|nr:autotransporter domain-containing protein [Thermovirga sp.]